MSRKPKQPDETIGVHYCFYEISNEGHLTKARFDLDQYPSFNRLCDGADSLEKAQQLLQKAWKENPGMYSLCGLLILPTSIIIEKTTS